MRIRITHVVAWMALASMSSIASAQYYPSLPQGAGYNPYSYVANPNLAEGEMAPEGYEAPMAEEGVAPMDGNCDACGTGGDCGGCGTCDTCCAPCWGTCPHRTGFFAETLFLQARNSDIAFAIPQDGINAVGTTPQGEVGVNNFYFDTGFRTGFAIAGSCCTSVTGAYTYYDTNTTDTAIALGNNVIRPLTMLPGTFNAGFNSQFADATSHLQFQFADMEYRAIWARSARHYVNWMAGARYVHLEQDFNVIYPFAPPDGTTVVGTDINFDGGGLRIGVDGEYRLFPTKLIGIYGKTNANLIAGKFNSRYQQTNQFNGVEGFLHTQEYRLVPILEAELGVSWHGPNDHIHLSTGYYVASWFNVITTQELINSVQNNNFVSLSRDAQDTLVFDGLVSRFEVRF